MFQFGFQEAMFTSELTSTVCPPTHCQQNLKSFIQQSNVWL